MDDVRGDFLNTLFSGLLFTAIGDPIIFGSFYCPRTAAIFILYVLIIYLLYLFCQIYRRSTASGISILRNREQHDTGNYVNKLNKSTKVGRAATGNRTTDLMHFSYSSWLNEYFHNSNLIDQLVHVTKPDRFP